MRILIKGIKQIQLALEGKKKTKPKLPFAEHEKEKKKPQNKQQKSGSI